MKPVINVTPLIDVLLVLLIIFMVVSPQRPAAFKAKIPAAPQPGPPLAPNPNTLIVTVNPDRTLALNRETGVGTTVESEPLTDKLRGVFADRQAAGIVRVGTNEIEKTVFVRAPKTLSYGDVARVVDAVRTAGAEPVGLQIDAP